MEFLPKSAGLAVPVLAVALCLSATTSADPLPEYISSKYIGPITKWLTTNPGYRLAVDADCSCADDIERVRAGNPPVWPPIPAYHPFYVVGDFRSDGAEDVAVGVIAIKRADKFRVLIIHGKPANGPITKPFLSEELDFRQGLFYGPPRPKPWRLLVGPFESEGVTFEPARGGYRMSDEGSDD